MYAVYCMQREASLTVLSWVRHGRVVLHVAVLGMWHGGAAEAAVPAPGGGAIYQKSHISRATPHIPICQSYTNLPR